MNWEILKAFASGALMMGFAALGCFFFEFFRRTRDRLFLGFAIAFALLSVERLVLIVLTPDNEVNYYVYTVRLCGFISLAYGIWDRNLRKH
ncbi:MAG TPA: DUF5985 family protein [Candidatus Acidoferrum sp.]|nr:DUF5985 family protein [Candidatus Acidoferrum sp.]